MEENKQTKANQRWKFKIKDDTTYLKQQSFIKNKATKKAIEELRCFLDNHEQLL